MSIINNFLKVLLLLQKELQETVVCIDMKDDYAEIINVLESIWRKTESIFNRDTLHQYDKDTVFNSLYLIQHQKDLLKIEEEEPSEDPEQKILLKIQYYLKIVNQTIFHIELSPLFQNLCKEVLNDLAKKNLLSSSDIEKKEFSNPSSVGETKGMKSVILT